MYNGCYMPYPVIEDGRIDIAARCYEAAVYECAALSSLSLGDATTCALLRNESRRLLQLTNTQPTTTEQ